MQRIGSDPAIERVLSDLAEYLLGIVDQYLRRQGHRRPPWADIQELGAMRSLHSNTRQSSLGEFNELAFTLGFLI